MPVPEEPLIAPERLIVLTPSHARRLAQILAVLTAQRDTLWEFFYEHGGTERHPLMPERHTLETDAAKDWIRMLQGIKT